ncbi:MAG: hypothetical protein H6638_02735 [Ardenticatenales bacterium]|nr:hypothetical protein [Ardenticatenales bacterium]
MSGRRPTPRAQVRGWAQWAAGLGGKAVRGRGICDEGRSGAYRWPRPSPCRDLPRLQQRYIRAPPRAIQ